MIYTVGEMAHMFSISLGSQDTPETKQADTPDAE